MTLLTHSQPSAQLTALDRCDAPTTGPDGVRGPCGAAALVRVLLPSDLDLVFCGHHHRAHGTRLDALGARVVEQRSAG